MLLKSVFSFVVIFAWSLSSSAATVVCSGKVKHLAYHSPNKLMIRLDSMNAPVFFCSPDSDWTVAGTPYATGSETCKAMYSTFLAAKMSGKSIVSMYFDGDQVPSSCNAWNSWREANIRYYVVAE